MNRAHEFDCISALSMNWFSDWFTKVANSTLCVRCLIYLRAWTSFYRSVFLSRLMRSWVTIFRSETWSCIVCRHREDTHVRAINMPVAQVHNHHRTCAHSYELLPYACSSTRSSNNDFRSPDPLTRHVWALMSQSPRLPWSDMIKLPNTFSACDFLNRPRRIVDSSVVYSGRQRHYFMLHGSSDACLFRASEEQAAFPLYKNG